MNEADIKSEIKDIRKQLYSVKTWFELEDDNDLIDACIYQMEVLESRYRYLINKAKENNISLGTLNEGMLFTQCK